MSLGLLYYLGGRLDAIMLFFGVVTVLLFIFAVLLFVFSADEDEDKEDREKAKKKGIKTLITALIVGLLLTLLPNKTDFFIIVGIDPIVNEVKESLDEGKLGKVSDLIDKSLDKAIEKLEKKQ
jgi:amino acid transporter